METSKKILAPLSSLALSLALALPALPLLDTAARAESGSGQDSRIAAALAGKRHGADDPPGDDRGGRGGEAEPGDDRGGRGGGRGNGGSGGGNGAARSRAGTFKLERSLSVREGAGVARIVVERSRGQQGAASVRIAASAGTAGAGDFQAASAVLSWAAGDGSNKVFELPIVNDAASEPRETVKLTLSNATGGALIDPVRGKATLNILDDDGSKACVEGENTLCLAAGRFEVEAGWSARSGGAGRARALEASDEAATFAFAGAGAALRVRVLDACAADGNFWVAFDGAGAEDYLVKVTDTRTGLVREYAQTAGGVAETAWDTATFACGE